MEVIGKDKIEQWIVPYLSKGGRGTKPPIALTKIIQAILYRLKKGYQRRMILLNEFFDQVNLSCNSSISS